MSTQYDCGYVLIYVCFASEPLCRRELYAVDANTHWQIQTENPPSLFHAWRFAHNPESGAYDLTHPVRIQVGRAQIKELEERPFESDEEAEAICSVIKEVPDDNG